MLTNKFLWVIVIMALLAVGFVVSHEGACAGEKGDVLNEMVIIEGKVEILNHPRLGKAPASLTTIIFQRTDCGKCLIAALTNDSGDYKITVGRGRYKIIKRSAAEGGEPSVDMLAPDQTRYIDATSLQYGKYGNHLDIKLLLPSR